MAAPISRCRGFTNPVIFLIRHSLEASLQQPSAGRSTTSTAIHHLRWTSRRSFATGGRPTSAVHPNIKVVPRAAPVKPGARGPVATTPQLDYARTLASRSAPTTLYEAPPSRIFLVSSYMAGLFTALAAGANMWFNVYYPPEGTKAWITYAFGAVGIVMAAFGTRFAMMPAAMVRSITVLPTATKAGAGSSSSPAAKAAAAASQPVLLEVTTRRSLPIPFLPLKRIRVEPQQVVMKARLYNPRVEPSPQEKALQQREAEARRKARQQYERDHLMTAPFRDGIWAAGTILANIRRGLTGEGFAPIEVDGAKYKLDITRAWVLEDGRALDRIVKIEEDPNLSRAAAYLYR